MGELKYKKGEDAQWNSSEEVVLRDAEFRILFWIDGRIDSATFSERIY